MKTITKKRPPRTTPTGTEPWTRPELLGVVVDTDRMEVEIKPERRDALKEEIRIILDVTGKLPPGQASKLKGKLYFAATTFFGRTGRAFLGPSQSVSTRSESHTT